MVRSPAPAVIVSVAVSPGDEVAVGDPLVVLESMKMETAVKAELPGPGQVGAGGAERAGRRRCTRSLQLEPAGHRGGVGAGRRRRPRVRYATRAGLTAPSRRCAPYLLGYDLDPAAMRRIEHGDDPGARWRPTIPSGSGARTRSSQLFADLCADLAPSARNRPRRCRASGCEHPRSTSSPACAPTKREPTELPPVFLDHLLGVLRHYGIEGLAPSTDGRGRAPAPVPLPAAARRARPRRRRHPRPAAGASSRSCRPRR